MKHISIISFFFLLFLCGNAFAQVPQRGDVDINCRGFGKYVDENGNKLSKDDLKQVLTAYEYSDYMAAKRKMTTGIVLTSVGVAAGAFGALSINSQSNETAEGIVSLAMLPVMIGGVVCVAIGVPKLFISGHRFRSIAKEHNSNNDDINLSLGATQNGVGFALSF
ncbi:MAG: hypothetical protein IKH63_14640 [Prevotella sp.]|nr:hypothetical protein [Prevotella sp.]